MIAQAPPNHKSPCQTRTFQVGVIEDQENRPRLAKLLRFFSSKSEDAFTSLEEYCGRMKEGQKGIYYMVRGCLKAAIDVM